jgi:hypothetical protein
MPPKYLPTEVAAEQAGIGQRYLQKLCAEGKVKGAQQIGRAWVVPEGFKWAPQKPGPKPRKGRKPPGR